MHCRLLSSTLARDLTDDHISRTYSWFVAALLMTAYTLSFIDRRMLSLMVGPLQADLNLSDTQIGGTGTLI